MNTVELAESLTQMVGNGDYVAGHSIFIGRGDGNLIINKILSEGFIIHDSKRGLPFTSRYFQNDYASSLHSLLDLVRVSLGIVVIIKIPGELLSDYDSKYFESYSSTSILLQDTGRKSDYCTDVYGNPTSMALLPNSYILGYLDCKKDMFIENPNFAFYDDIRNDNVSNIKPKLDKKYRKMIKSLN